MREKKIRILAGATASGKTAAAVLWAKHIQGVVVNADSLQVYEDIPLLTARPLTEEQQGVPHYLYGILDCFQTCSVKRWLDLAVPVLLEQPAPIVVGGTGMYLNALINGLNEIPSVDPDVREQVRQMAIEDVQKQVKECSAVDAQRLRRALEVQLSTGKPLAWFQAQPKKHFIEATFETVWINPPRPVLYERCERRFEEMIERGAVEQVRALMLKNPTGGVTQAIGYAEIGQFLSGAISECRMRDLAKQATRNYAKRQTTWFKHQLKADKIIDNSLDLLNK